jgi:hypothetical protein
MIKKLVDGSVIDTDAVCYISKFNETPTWSSISGSCSRYSIMIIGQDKIYVTLDHIDGKNKQLYKTMEDEHKELCNIILERNKDKF